MSRKMDSVGVGMPEDLKDRIDRACALIGVKTGDTPSRSEFIRDAAEEKLERLGEPGGEVSADEPEHVEA